MKVIDDTGIVEKHSNNGKEQILLVEHNGQLYKLKILVESYEFQSYARLYILGDDKKFELLRQFAPSSYGITNFYNYDSTVYEPIIKDMKKLIKKLGKVLWLITNTWNCFQFLKKNF